MLEAGSIIQAVVIDHHDETYFAQAEGQTLRVHSTQANYQHKEKIKGFAYQNQKGAWQLLTEIPQVTQTQFSWGEVVQSRHDLGVFIDIGLPDKDVVLSMDDLPLLYDVWPKKGDHLYVALKSDQKNRLWARLANDDQFKEIGHFSREFTRNETVTGTSYQAKKVGSLVLLSDQRLAFLHHSEWQVEPRLGERVNGRVIGLTQDGRLSISLRPLAYEEIEEDAKMILAVLKRSPQGQFSYHDKSSPEDIRAYFGISKGAFKRALGSLLKLRLVQSDHTGTKLTAKGQQYRD